jgi:competence protein ComEC
LNEQIPACAEGVDLLITLKVSRRALAGDTRFSRIDALVEKGGHPGCVDLAGRRLRLNSYGRDDLDAGVRARLVVRLRRPWGFANPAGFDYERWLVANRYAATGYVRTVEGIERAPRSTDPFWYHLNEDDFVNPGLIRALALGDGSSVSTNEWEIFRRTGTVHLMVVSGLHVAILGGIAYLALGTLLRLVPRLHRRHVRTASAVTALGTIWAYAGAAGFGAPVLRASLMVSLVAVAALAIRGHSVGRSLSIAAASVVLIEPLQVLQQGFWLSFGAVACLTAFFAPRVRRPTWVAGLVLTQCILSLALTPVLSWWVDAVPTVSAAANLVVVPLMSLAVAPILFAGLLLNATTGIDALIHLADFGLHWLIAVLDWFDAWNWPTLGPRRMGQCLPAAMAALLAMVPGNPLRRGACVLAAACLAIPAVQGVPLGQFAVHVLDAGQGSATIVDTTNKRLLIDTGARFASGFDTASAAIIPTLRKTGPDRLDLVLVSHDDNDHSGGLARIRATYPDAPVLTTATGCASASEWVWDGVSFATHYNPKASSKNARSCTLLVASNNAAAYFAGDITKASERVLLPRLPRAIDLLVAPHHGSATSSSWPFVRHLRARIAVFQAGRGNRYGHPHADVVARYRAVGTRTLSTGHVGAVTWHSWTPRRCEAERECN